MFTLTRLLTLNLSRGLINTLSSDIGLLVNLTNLNLSYNLIKLIPDVFVDKFKPFGFYWQLNQRIPGGRDVAI